MTSPEEAFELYCKNFTAMCEKIRSSEGYSSGRPFLALNPPLDLTAETDILYLCEKNALSFIDELKFLPSSVDNVRYLSDPNDYSKSQIEWVKECFEKYINTQLRMAHFKELITSSDAVAIVDKNGPVVGYVKSLPKTITQYYLVFSFYYYIFGVGFFSVNKDYACECIYKALEHIFVYVEANTSCKAGFPGKEEFEKFNENELKKLRRILNSSVGGNKLSDNKRLVVDEAIRLANEYCPSGGIVRVDDVIKSIAENLAVYVNDQNIKLGRGGDLYDKLLIWNEQKPEVQSAINNAITRRRRPKNNCWSK